MNNINVGNLFENVGNLFDDIYSDTNHKEVQIARFVVESNEIMKKVFYLNNMDIEKEVFSFSEVKALVKEKKISVENLLRRIKILIENPVSSLILNTETETIEKLKKEFPDFEIPTKYNFFFGHKIVSRGKLIKAFCVFVEKNISHNINIFNSKLRLVKSKDLINKYNELYLDLESKRRNSVEDTNDINLIELYILYMVLDTVFNNDAYSENTCRDVTSGICEDDTNWDSLGNDYDYNSDSSSGDSSSGDSSSGDSSSSSSGGGSGD